MDLQLRYLLLLLKNEAFHALDRKVKKTTATIKQKIEEFRFTKSKKSCVLRTYKTNPVSRLCDKKGQPMWYSKSISRSKATCKRYIFTVLVGILSFLNLKGKIGGTNERWSFTQWILYLKGLFKIPRIRYTSSHRSMNIKRHMTEKNQLP